jgi:hercynylcysteine S-oxide lyase
MVPRGCAILYVPVRNQHLIRTTMPTSGGYLEPAARAEVPPRDYFVKMFEKISTTDNTPYICVLRAIEFREHVCGGEANVRNYCRNIARQGGQLMAERLGTEVLEVQSTTALNCCFAQVRLPLLREELGINDVQAVKLAHQMMEQTAADFDTYIPTKYYAGGFWSRVSGQIYLELNDFERASEILLEICRQKRLEFGISGTSSPNTN